MLFHGTAVRRQGGACGCAVQVHCTCCRPHREAIVVVHVALLRRWAHETLLKELEHIPLVHAAFAALLQGALLLDSTRSSCAPGGAGAWPRRPTSSPSAPLSCAERGAPCNHGPLERLGGSQSTLHCALGAAVCIAPPDLQLAPHSITWPPRPPLRQPQWPP